MFEIEIGEIRGHPGSYLSDVYFNGYRLEKDTLCLSNDYIRGQVAPQHFHPNGQQCLVLICNPISRSEIAPDQRELGFPIFSFRIDGERSPMI